MDDSGLPHDTALLLEAALPWVDDHLARAGITRTGIPTDIRVRSWATVVPIPTDRGTHWFKAASHVTAHEIGLYPHLVSTAPDLVLHPLATDSDRAWMLLPDGGTSLLHSLKGDDLVDRLIDVLPSYARMQRDLSLRVNRMLALGVPDLRPHILPDRFDGALAAVSALVTTPDDANAISQVAALRPRYLAWCEMVGSSPVAPSLDHSDLHANNILLPGGPDGPAVVYDWGDSVVAHPFSTLLVTLRALMDTLETTPDDPRLARVRDAYLEPFTDLTSRTDLIALADAACWSSVVIRTLTWVRVLALGSPANPDWSTAPLEWIKSFLNDTWLE